MSSLKPYTDDGSPQVQRFAILRYLSSTFVCHSLQSHSKFISKTSEPFLTASLFTINITATLLTIPRSLPELFSSKESALRKGIVIGCRDNLTYATHHFHAKIRENTDLLWGRTGDASGGEGIAIARIFPDRDSNPSEDNTFVIITYRFPVVSALAVSKLLEFVSSTSLLSP